MLRRIYRRCAGDVLRCKMPVQPALGYSVLMSDQPHRSKGCAARMREYPALSRRNVVRNGVVTDGPNPVLGIMSLALLSLTFPELASPAADFHRRFLLLSTVLTAVLWGLSPLVSTAVFRGPQRYRAFCRCFSSAGFRSPHRRPIGIFAGFLSAGLYQEPPPRFSPVPLGQRGCYESCPAGGCPTLGAPVLSICYRWCRSIPKPHF